MNNIFSLSAIFLAIWIGFLVTHFVMEEKDSDWIGKTTWVLNKALEEGKSWVQEPEEERVYLDLYTTYVRNFYASSLAMVIYLSMGVLAILRILWVNIRGGELRFGGSWIFVIIFCVFFIANADERREVALAPTDAAIEKWAQEKAELVTKIGEQAAERYMATQREIDFMHLPTVLSLLFCYASVTWWGRSNLSPDAVFLQTAASHNVADFKYTTYTDGVKTHEETKTEFVGGGCLAAFLMSAVALAFAPFFVCITFFFAHVVPSLFSLFRR